MKLTVKQKEYVALGCAIFVMLLLFHSSAMPYREQSAVSLIDTLLSHQPFKKELQNIAFLYGGSEVSIVSLGYGQFIEFFLRKFAHFMSFLLLAYAWTYGLKSRLKEKWLLWIIVLLLCVSYAALDEFHQSLTPQRTPLLEDVLLDSTGALTGLMVATLVIGKSKKRAYRKRRK